MNYVASSAHPCIGRRKPQRLAVVALFILFLIVGCAPESDITTTTTNTPPPPPPTSSAAVTQAPPEQRAAIEESMARAKADADRTQRKAEARNAAPQAPK